jgi:hypothetical protein
MGGWVDRWRMDWTELGSNGRWMFASYTGLIESMRESEKKDDRWPTANSQQPAAFSQPLDETHATLPTILTL